jgi:hypothetical protein
VNTRTPEKIYLAGPMSGIPDWNYPAFDQAAMRLRAAGYEVKNPADNHGRRTDLPRATYLRTAVRQVTRCRAIALLPGWEESPGARLEVAVAEELGLPVCLVEDMLGEPDHVPVADHVSWPCGDCGFEVPFAEDWCPACTEGKYADLAAQAARERLADAAKLAREVINKPSVRAQTLDEAKRLVTGDRNAQYGPPTQDFSRTADLLTALGYGLTDHEGVIHALQPSDIATIMVALKLSRLMHSRGKRDSWVDLAGYAACGAECAEEADE